MKLHIKNLALSAGAKESETVAVQSKLEEILKATRRISLSNAIEVLNDLRRRGSVETLIPSKTFLWGEYSALVGGSAGILTGAPFFELKIDHSLRGTPMANLFFTLSLLRVFS